MTDAINTHNRPGSTAVSSQAKTKAGSQANDSASPTQPDNQASPSSIVELSNPDLLKNLSEQIEKYPEVNEARVASIKQSLADGDYKPDAEVIARKFSEIEKLLP
ncbi:MAG: flagellar biosynthesis anti-sigma factor FlgM [Gammaproteobacteria bacterium]|nr:flagellar biosynthesis anti-sigma factor FlgM [Gammaproteobacteria bacterium]